MFRTLKSLGLVALATLVVGPAPLRADALEYLKGCLIMGGVGAGGAALATAQSKVKLTSQAFGAAAGLSCLVGAVIAKDTVEKAEAKTYSELTPKNERLKILLLKAQDDVCRAKGLCGPEGIVKKNADTKRLDEVMGAPLGGARRGGADEESGTFELKSEN